MRPEHTNECEQRVTAKYPFYEYMVDIDRHCSFKATHIITLDTKGRRVRVCGRHAKRYQKPMYAREIQGIRELTEEEKNKGWFEA